MWVISEIRLCTNEDDLDVIGGVMSDLWDPFVLDVLEGRWLDYGETDEENVRLWV